MVSRLLSRKFAGVLSNWMLWQCFLTSISMTVLLRGQTLHILFSTPKKGGQPI